MVTNPVRTPLLAGRAEMTLHRRSRLSEAQRVSLKLPIGGPGSKGVEAVLTRQRFEQLATPLFQRMRGAVDEACWQVGSLGCPQTLCAGQRGLRGLTWHQRLYAAPAVDGKHVKQDWTPCYVLPHHCIIFSQGVPQRVDHAACG